MATNFGKLNFAVAFNPQTAFPLDARSYFESYTAAEIAASGAKEAGSDKSTYYYGQTIVVNTGTKATLYIIQPDNTLKEVGSTTLGDGKSIEIKDGKLQLKGFGTGYYKYNPEVEGKYEYVSGFKDGLEPRVVSTLLEEANSEFHIEWYEPNPELENRVFTLEKTVLIKKEVDVLPETLEENVIYYLKYTTSSGTVHYEEYQLVNGSPQKTGDTNSDFATEDFVLQEIAKSITGAEDGVLVKSINTEQFELTEGSKLNLKAISTDLLVQGTKTLVLGGGSSKDE